MAKSSKSKHGSNGRSTSAAEPIKGLQGRRFTEEQKQQALKLIAAEVMPRASIAQLIGTTTESLRRWVQEAPALHASVAPGGNGATPRTRDATQPAETTVPAKRPPRSPYTPHDPGSGIAEHEVAAILELKRQHPSMGPAQLRAQLKRFRGWRLSNKAIARVLRDHGFLPVHRGSRPLGPEPIRFEAPRRNALWQADFTEVGVGPERLHVLVILDDFSRYVVGHALAETPSSQVATETLRAAIARHGKPEAIRTDRGGAFIAFSKETDFGRYLDAELIDHIVGKSYSPRGGGKVESAIKTVQRELWELREFTDRHDAERQLTAFFAEYNERRAHMGIDGLTPADRFFGRADRVLAAVDAISRRRQGAAALLGAPGAPIEELAAGGTGAPLEVLRLVLADGAMELRFCGARVRLGAVDTGR
jgi:transposase InsO family protein/transposase-like protein